MGPLGGVTLCYDGGVVSVCYTPCMSNQTCVTCGKELPPGGRSTRKYCDSTCRYHKWQASKTRITIPTTLRWTVLHRDGFRCRYCGASPTRLADNTPAHTELRVDHVVSVNDGGDLTNTKNLVTSCLTCNSGKGSRSIDPADIPDL